MSTAAISKRRRKPPLPQHAVLSLASAQPPHNTRALFSDYLNMQRNYDRSANRIARLRVLLDQNAISNEPAREQAREAILLERSVVPAFNAGRIMTANLIFESTGRNITAHYLAPFYDPNSRLAYLPPGVTSHIRSFIPPLLDNAKIHYRGTDLYYYPLDYARGEGHGLDEDIHNREVRFRQERFPSL